MKTTVLKQLPKMALALGLLTTAAHARDFHLDYGGQHLQGQNTLTLKNEMRNQYPGVRLQRFKLKKVVLVAKSKHGGGSAKLLVGGNSSYEKNVPGHPSEFFSNYDFTRVPFRNPSYASQGRWQIKLRGNIKVKKVIVKLERIGGGGPSGPGGPLVFTQVDEMKFDKFRYETKDTHVNLNRVKQIRLKARKSSLDIQSVEVEFGNGQVQYIYQLEGGLSEGRTISHNLGSTRNVRKITITATTTGLFGSRGRIQVMVGRR
jgi:hypothetical protein